MNPPREKRGGGPLETYSEEQMLWHIEQANELSQDAHGEMSTMDMSPMPGIVEPKDVRNGKAALRRKLAVMIETLKGYVPVVQEEIRRLERNIAQIRISLAGLFNDEPKPHLLDASAQAHQERERLLELYEQLLQLISQLEELLQETWGRRSGMPLLGPQPGGFIPGHESTHVPNVPDLTGMAGLGPAGPGTVPVSPSVTGAAPPASLGESCPGLTDLAVLDCAGDADD